MRLFGVFMALVLGTLPLSSTWAQSKGEEPAAQTVVSNEVSSAPGLDQVKDAFKVRFPGVDVEMVRNTPVQGLYEVQVGMDLLYTDADVSYVFQGSLIDAREKTDLTAARLEQLTATPFASLPLQHAIKQVKGTGARQIAVFEDPNCGFCKRFHQTLKDVDNITVYSFLLPILSADSEVKARNIWCAKDQEKVWKDWMVNDKKPAEAMCDTPVEQVKELAKKLMVQGTPAIFFADDSRVNGALPLDQLNKKLDAL